MWNSAAVCIYTLALQNTLEGGDRLPGDFGFAYTKGCTSEADKLTMRAKELENGRAAMLAFAGVVTQAVALDKGFPYF